MKNVMRIAAPLCLLAVAACSRTDRADRDNMGTGTGVANDRTGTGVTTDRTGTGTGTGVNTDRTVTGQTTVTGANVGRLGNDVAIRRIVESRCAREMSCNNVGSGKHYASNETCMNNVRGDMKDDLNAKDCPNGIDQKELDECLAAIKAESCGNPIETLSRVAACRTSDLCLATSDRNR